MKIGKYDIHLESSHGWQLGLLGRTWRVKSKHSHHRGLDLELPIVSLHLELVKRISETPSREQETSKVFGENE